ncbi:MAG: hypothetical protein PHE25_03210, partial [Candidatus Gracilibacteria bacterium]|nr:hypothetical protein [Candidatus Gracilibacteria bacterium]
GLKAIKGIGDGPIEAIKNSRKDGKYTSLEDFIIRAGKDVINKKSLEALILSGALDEFGERGELFKNIENIIRHSKAGEKKSLTNQIGLFDHIENSNNLVLTKFEPFSFEETIVGEKEVIGLSISGHPLDGLSRYIEKRSQNAKILKMDFLEIEKLPEKNKSRTTIVQTVGYIKSIRKMMTKSGGNMVFLYCESFNYDFEITIFPKDYDKFADKIEIGKIIIVSGGLNINTEYKRKAILARDIKSLTLTQVREQAISLGLFDNKKFNSFLKNNLVGKVEEDKEKSKIILEGNIEEENNENILNEDFIEIKEEIDKYLINIPSTVKKEKLIELKSFMLGLETGNIKVFLDLKGQEIDTKISLKNIKKLQNWEKENFII